ncbi:MAG: branched-chain amino acid ABC transporter permease [Anaerolineae bacterium]|nr:branched-chain amino acid ABC transporter permease [Anaerolineae bacterium]
MWRTIINTALMALALVLLLALMGVFESFAGHDLVADRINVNTGLLAVLMIGTGYWAVLRTGHKSLTLGMAQGAVAGLIVGTGLAALTVLERAVDLRLIFPNYARSLFAALEVDGLPIAGLLLVIIGAALGGWLACARPRMRTVVIVGLLLTAIVSLAGERLRTMLAFADALVLVAAVLSGVFVSMALGVRRLSMAMLVSGLNGAAIAVAVILVALGGGLGPAGILRLGQVEPVLVGFAQTSPAVLILVLAFLGAYGGLLRNLPRRSYYVLQYGMALIFVIGFSSTQPRWNAWSALVALVVFLFVSWHTSHQAEISERHYVELSSQAQRVVRAAFYALAFFGLLTLPLFVGQFGTNTLNLVGLYLLLSIGLRIVLDNVGLFNLGIVAFFALGAYTIGILTTPNMLTCGGALPLTPGACTGVLTFWQALPLTLVVCAVFGVLFAVPLVNLRGDYVAIVTLAVGEVIRLVLRADDFHPLFGAAQGIPSIPRPIVDLPMLGPSVQLRFDREGALYYLILIAIVVAVIAASRLRNSRIGRAWRAIRADKRAAQTLGIDIGRSYVTAFAASAVIAGLAGALFAVRLYGAYPDSFTFQVAIIALGLVITGLGRIMALVIATLALIGLPEFVPELADYRLLILGIAIVVAMRFVTRTWRSPAL